MKGQFIFVLTDTCAVRGVVTTWKWLILDDDGLFAPCPTPKLDYNPFQSSTTFCQCNIRSEWSNTVKYFALEVLVKC